jgi:hypothetical protein
MKEPFGHHREDIIPQDQEAWGKRKNSIPIHDFSSYS